MAEYIELEALETEGEVKKIKTPFAHIVVGGAAEKPCYSIMWWDSVDKELNIGYSSFNIDFVWEWFREQFEVIENPAADVVEVVRCRDCVYMAKHWGRALCAKKVFSDDYSVKVLTPTKLDNFCNYGEKVDGKGGKDTNVPTNKTDIKTGWEKPLLDAPIDGRLSIPTEKGDLTAAKAIKNLHDVLEKEAMRNDTER